MGTTSPVGTRMSLREEIFGGNEVRVSIGGPCMMKAPIDRTSKIDIVGSEIGFGGSSMIGAPKLLAPIRKEKYIVYLKWNGLVDKDTFYKIMGEFTKTLYNKVRMPITKKIIYKGSHALVIFFKQEYKEEFLSYISQHDNITSKDISPRSTFIIKNIPLYADNHDRKILFETFGIRLIKQIAGRNGEDHTFLADADLANRENILNCECIHMAGQVLRVIPTCSEEEDLNKYPQCYKCQGWGHWVGNCTREHPVCVHCADHHESRQCENRAHIKCINCGGRHKAYDHRCPAFKAYIKNFSGPQAQSANMPSMPPRLISPDVSFSKAAANARNATNMPTPRGHDVASEIASLLAPVVDQLKSINAEIFKIKADIDELKRNNSGGSPPLHLSSQNDELADLKATIRTLAEQVSALAAQLQKPPQSENFSDCLSVGYAQPHGKRKK